MAASVGAVPKAMLAYFDSDKCEKEWANFRKLRVIISLKNDECRQKRLNQLAGSMRYSRRRKVTSKFLTGCHCDEVYAAGFTLPITGARSI
jgi:hypothetical protein